MVRTAVLCIGGVILSVVLPPEFQWFGAGLSFGGLVAVFFDLSRQAWEVG